jgi:aminopeptidase 2
MSKLLDKKKFRLPKNASPSKYKIELHPDLKVKTFDGKVEILLNILEESKSISINVAELEIKTIVLKENSTELNNSISWNIDNDYEIMSINFENPIPIGEYSLIIEFSGVLNDKLRGFYHSSFKDHNGNIQSIATTQFESTDARRAFPCFDEPEYKSVFSVSLVLENELFCVSNAAEKNI